jgi:creatinine amidohydrolase
MRRNAIQKTVRYELMYGREATEAIRSYPVGYLPIGCLERHGDHLPMGLDVIKAHKVCCIAAREIGGVVFPPHYYAGIHKMTEDQLEKFTGEWGNIYTDNSSKQSLVDILWQISLAGFRVLVLYSGHYPPCQMDLIMEVSHEFVQHPSLTVIPFGEGTILAGDHAGISETSLALYLDENLVRMSSISEVNYADHGWQEHNAPDRATKEKGEKDTGIVINYLHQEIQKALQKGKDP